MATGVEKMTHLQFADDTILFGSTSRREERTIKSCPDDYCMASRQKINWHKSEVFFVNTSINLQGVLSRIRNLKVANFQGTPLFIGSNITHYWKHLIDKCKSKLAIWKGKWLSFASKLTMIKSVLSAIPVFSMACLRLLDGN